MELPHISNYWANTAVLQGNPAANHPLDQVSQ